MKRFVIMAIGGLCLVGSFAFAQTSTQDQDTAKQSALAKQLYEDPKGYFQIRPPTGWRAEEYKNDPRGKVKFVCPENKNVTFLVTGMATGMRAFEELLSDSKQQAARSQAKYASLNATSSTEASTFQGSPAVKGSLALPGRVKQMSIELLRGNSYYMLSYAAPPDFYEKYLDAITQSIETFDALVKDVREIDAMASLVASKKRLAELNLQMGFLDVALRAVEEGLAVDPNNQDLKQLKQKIVSKTLP